MTPNKRSSHSARRDTLHNVHHVGEVDVVPLVVIQLLATKKNEDGNPKAEFRPSKICPLCKVLLPPPKGRGCQLCRT